MAAGVGGFWCCVASDALFAGCGLDVLSLSEVTITEPGGSMGGAQLLRWSSFLAINWDKCISTKISKNHNRCRFFSQLDGVLNAAVCPCGLKAPRVSRQAQGSMARAAWSCATSGGAASTTFLKLKKPARPPAPGVAAFSSLEKDLEIIISPICFRIFGVIYSFIAYQ